MAKIANFEINIELQGLKIHVKGDRELAPQIATEVANKISGMIQPAGLIEVPKEQQNGHRTIDAIPTGHGRRRRRVAKQNAGVPNGTGAAVLNWNHDPAKWGTPIQGWKGWQKVAWLLKVVEEETGTDGLTQTEIVDVFTTKFKAAGPPVKNNIARDLGNKSDYFGSLDERWHLKQAGKEEALKLVAEAKGGAATS